MDVSAVMEQLAALGNEARKKHMAKRGAGENLFGVPLGSLRAQAEKLGRDHELALSLWETGNTDAMMLSAMMLDPLKLEKERAERMVERVKYIDLLDELVFDAIAEAPYASELREAWIDSEDDVMGRVGWSLVVSDILGKKFKPEALSRYVNLVEQGLRDAPTLKQESMNRALCEIGIRYEAFTDRCLEIGERLGVYKDQKVPKGCTSAYAPNWIAAGIKRRKPSKKPE
jgi:3-methyladenine DNA glycosylase AlkD